MCSIANWSEHWSMWLHLKRKGAQWGLGIKVVKMNVAVLTALQKVSTFQQFTGARSERLFSLTCLCCICQINYQFVRRPFFTPTNLAAFACFISKINAICFGKSKAPSASHFQTFLTGNGSECEATAAFFAACPAVSVVVWNSDTKGDVHDSRISTRSGSHQSDQSSQTFSGTCCRQMSGCAHVRRCPDWQCWRDSAFGLRNPEKKDREKTKRRKKIQEKIQTNPRRETGTMRSKGRARKLATSRCNIPFFFPFETCHLIYSRYYHCVY